MSNNHKALDDFIVQAMEKASVPGVSVGIWHDGETYTAGYGVTNVNHPLEVTDETLFLIGSIAKTYAATVIMRLVERGGLDLDVPIRTYLPDFKVADETASAQATIRHLLTHSAGWAGDLFGDTEAGADALPKYMAKIATLKQLAPVGTVMSYNNSGFYLAGYIIERVTGQSYQEVAKELKEPLGLQHSYFDPGDIMVHRFAVGHYITADGITVATPWPISRADHAPGGITCNVGDLLRYARFQMGDGTTEDGSQLLTSDSLRLMQSAQITIGGIANAAVGLAWHLSDYEDVRIVSHSGGYAGQVSGLMMVPKHNLAMAIVTNGERGGEIGDEAIRWILKQYLGVEMSDPTPIDSSEAELTPYVGRYSRPFADIELRLENGQLMAQPTFKLAFGTADTPPPSPPPVPCALYQKDCLLAVDGPFKNKPLGEIVRRADGSIGWLRMMGRIHRRIQE